MTTRSERSVLLRRATMQTPSIPALPLGVRYRGWQSGDEVRVPALLGEAFGSHRASFAALREFWRGYPGLGPQGVIVVESGAEEVVATATTRVVDGRGWIHLVAVRPDHVRRGLGTLVVLSGVRSLCTSGARTVWVGTGADRLAAIRLYLRLDFEPVVEDAAATAVWAEIRRALASDASADATAPGGARPVRSSSRLP